MSAFRRIAALATTVAAVALTGAASTEAATQRFSFDDVPVATLTTGQTGPYTARGLVIPYGGCTRIGVYADSDTFQAYTRPQFLGVSDEDMCGARMVLGFGPPAGPAALLRLAIKGKLSADMPGTVRVSAYDASNTVIETRTVPLGDWQLVTFRAPVGRPIQALLFEVEDAIGPVLLLDDVLVSTTVPAPKATVSAAPATTTVERTSTIRWTTNADTSRVTCSLDGAAAAACSGAFGPRAYSLGAHRLTITAYDAYGTPDPSPPTVRWTVVNPPVQPTTPTPTTPTAPTPTTPSPTTPQPTTPAPATPTPTPLAADLCAGGPDGDRDGVADRCDTVGLPAGTPPIAGQRASVTVTSGEVFVRLPGGRASRARAPLARLAAAPEPGFVPLKGIAVLPVDSTVDARGGSIDLDVATGASGRGAPKHATSKVSAAIFQIRQGRAARKAKRRGPVPPSPTDLLLRNPEGAIRAASCTDRRSTAPVRSLSATIPKGVVRVTGFASRTVAERPGTTLRVVDRCNGTLTSVGAGRAIVTTLLGSRARRHRVRSGQGFFAPGNLLRTEGRKGR